MMYYGYDMMGPWFWVMGFFWTVFIVIAVVIFYNLLKHSNVRDTGESDKSLDILNERLARGEVTEEEYTRIRNVLINGKSKKQ